MTDKLNDNIERLTYFAEDSANPKCPNCGRALEDTDDIIFTNEYGFCLMCDAEAGDRSRRDYEELSREVDNELEENDYTRI